MLLSFFDKQDGPFSLGLVSIAARRTERYSDNPDKEDVTEDVDEKSDGVVQARKRSGWFGWPTSCLGF